MKRFISSLLAIAMMFTLLGTVAPCVALADTDDVVVIYDEDFSEDTYTVGANWITAAGTAGNLPAGWGIVGYNGKSYSAANSIKVVSDPTGSMRGNVLEIIPDNAGYSAGINKLPGNVAKLSHTANKGLYVKQSMYIDKETAAGLLPAGANSHRFLFALAGRNLPYTRNSTTVTDIQASEVNGDNLEVTLHGAHHTSSTPAVTSYDIPLDKWVDIEYYIDVPGIKLTDETTYEVKYHMWIDGAYVSETVVSYEKASNSYDFPNYFYGIAFMPTANSMRGDAYPGSTVKPIVYVDDIKASYVPTTDVSTMSVTVNADNSILTASFTGGTLYNTTADLKNCVAILDAAGTEVSGAVTAALVKDNGAALEVAVTGLSSGAAYTLKLKDGITNSNRISLAGKTADFVTARVATPLTYIYDEDFSEDTYTVGENWITAAGTAGNLPAGWGITGYNAKSYSADNSIKVVTDPTGSTRGNVLEIIPDNAGYSAGINKLPGNVAKLSHTANKGLYVKQSMYIDKETAAGLLPAGANSHRFLFALAGRNQPYTRNSTTVTDIQASEVNGDNLEVTLHGVHHTSSTPKITSYDIPLDKWVDIEYYVDVPGIKLIDETTYEVKYHMWIDGAYVSETVVSYEKASGSYDFPNYFYGIAFLPTANSMRGDAYPGSTVKPIVYVDDLKAAYVDPLTLKSQEVNESTVTFTFSDLIKPLVSTADVFTVTDSEGEVIEDAVTSVSVVDDKLTVTLNSALSGVYTLTPIANVIRSDSEATQTYTAPVTVTILPDITVSGVTYSVSGTTCTVNYTITNNTAAPANYTAIAAVYNANEGLIGVTVLDPDTLATNTPVTDSANVAFDGTITTVRFFVWDNLTSASPLTTATTAVIATAQQ